MQMYQNYQHMDMETLKVVESLRVRRGSFPFRRKSETKLPILAKSSAAKKVVSKSPILPRRQLSPDPLSNKARFGSNTLQLPDDAAQQISRSLEDLNNREQREPSVEDSDTGTKENGSGCSDGVDELDANTTVNGESLRRRAAMEHMQDKINRTMEQIKEEQATKEANVNEYLRLAGEADKQQLLRIKQMFEKKNQKCTQSLSTLQKKLEKYNKTMRDIETYGAHRQTKDKLKDMGQGLKGVGANIVDGITGFSGSETATAHLHRRLRGVVGNIKGAKESIVSKPREFAHLIKNKFGSADNISSLKASEDSQADDGEKQGGGTLPAREIPPASTGKSEENQTPSFKYNSDEDNSSITSGSGFGAHSSPQSNSANTSQQIVLPQAALDTLVQELRDSKESSRQLQETLQRVIEDFDTYKMSCQQDLSEVRSVLEEDKFKMERIEEQMNDIGELNQHEVNNLKQDIGSMEEKIEYRLEERTTDIQDLLENCQTRVTKMELQQQQQQIISMEMVENVTFRTILTKLINVVLALLAVLLVFVSTFANLLAPFLTTRARILSTVVMVTSLLISWNNWTHICDFVNYLIENIRYILPNR